jgi:hypothetical protein
MQLGGAPKGPRALTLANSLKKAEAENPELIKEKKEKSIQGHYKLFNSNAPGKHNPSTNMRDGNHNPGCYGH